MEEINLFEVVPKILGIIILLLAILFVLTWAGVLKCSSLPLGNYWCGTYDSVMGSPRVLIVYGNEGLGEPETLRELLLSPGVVGATTVDMSHVNNISLGNLKRYKLVIVEKAKVISTEQLEMFRDYVVYNGGRLVWVGDAGVQDSKDVDYSDVNGLSETVSNPWVRVEETEDSYDIFEFDKFLGVRYVGNYCELTNCNSEFFTVGALIPEPSRDHPLIKGLSSVLNLKINDERDFSVVSQISNVPNSMIVMTVDFGGNIYTKEGIEVEDIGSSVPFIIANGFGERVVYYSYPLEYLVEDNEYYSFVKNMYYGMLGR